MKLLVTLPTLALFALASCQTVPTSDAERSALQVNAAATLAVFVDKDPTLNDLIAECAGYAVFPSVGKGAATLGGAYGRGVVFEDGNPTGWCEISQITIGFQAGGQIFKELIVFETAQALQAFKGNQLVFAADATIVAAEAGAGVGANFKNDTAIFYIKRAGLMYEASIGGRKYNFVSMQQ